MTFDARLRILRDAGQIGDQTLKRVKEAVGWLAERQLVLDEENGAMFVTHLAIALERLQKGEAVEGLAPALLTEVKGSKHCAAGEQIAKELEELWGIVLPESEKGYVMLHLCMLLEACEIQ